MISVPSMEALYTFEEQTDSAISLKRNGHQWYWSYEIGETVETSVDCFLEDSIHRIVFTNRHLILPIDLHIQILRSSSDVIHS